MTVRYALILLALFFAAPATRAAAQASTRDTVPALFAEGVVSTGDNEFSTAVTRPRAFADSLSGKHRGPAVEGADGEKEVSVTAQIPLSALIPSASPDMESRFAALCHLLVSKGVVTEAELVEAFKKGETKPDGSSE